MVDSNGNLTDQYEMAKMKDNPVNQQNREESKNAKNNHATTMTLNFFPEESHRGKTENSLPVTKRRLGHRGKTVRNPRAEILWNRTTLHW